MTLIALTFPGQGSQAIGMGRDVVAESPAARSIFEQADSLLEVRLSVLCFEGPEAELRATENAQPALLTHSVAVLELLRERGVELAPGFVAGHSLGEYSALVAAGSLDFPTALRLVRERGLAMRDSGRARPGTMAAVLGLKSDLVDAACEAATSTGIVVAANYNADDQIVISGDPAGVEQAGVEARARGAKRVLPLPVSGAFHSPLMASAAERLGAAIADATIADARVPLVANVTARPMQRADEIRRELVEQLTAPVRWAQSLATMRSAGVDVFVEIGAGQVLSGLARRAGGRGVSVRGPADVPALIELLSTGS